jgi:hypothetical protein
VEERCGGGEIEGEKRWNRRRGERWGRGRREGSGNKSKDGWASRVQYTQWNPL